jgi:hypothetical protein
VNCCFAVATSVTMNAAYLHVATELRSRFRVAPREEGKPIAFQTSDGVQLEPIPPPEHASFHAWLFNNIMGRISARSRELLDPATPTPESIAAGNALEEFLCYTIGTYERVRQALLPSKPPPRPVAASLKCVSDPFEVANGDDWKQKLDAAYAQYPLPPVAPRIVDPPAPAPAPAPVSVSAPMELPVLMETSGPAPNGDMPELAVEQPPAPQEEEQQLAVSTEMLDAAIAEAIAEEPAPEPPKATKPKPPRAPAIPKQKLEEMLSSDDSDSSGLPEEEMRFLKTHRLGGNDMVKMLSKKKKAAAATRPSSGGLTIPGGGGKRRAPPPPTDSDDESNEENLFQPSDEEEEEDDISEEPSDLIEAKEAAAKEGEEASSEEQVAAEEGEEEDSSSSVSVEKLAPEPPPPKKKQKKTVTIADPPATVATLAPVPAPAPVKKRKSKMEKAREEIMPKLPEIVAKVEQACKPKAPRKKPAASKPAAVVKGKKAATEKKSDHLPSLDEIIEIMTLLAEHLSGSHKAKSEGRPNTSRLITLVKNASTDPRLYELYTNVVRVSPPNLLAAECAKIPLVPGPNSILRLILRRLAAPENRQALEVRKVSIKDICAISGTELPQGVDHDMLRVDETPLWIAVSPPISQLLQAAHYAYHQPAYLENALQHQFSYDWEAMAASSVISNLAKEWLRSMRLFATFLAASA